MLRFSFLWALSSAVAFGGGCSDLGSERCVEGQLEVDGACVGEPSSGRFEDPLAEERPLTLGCASILDPNRAYVLTWRLEVDPGPIVGGEVFGAAFRGTISIREDLVLDTLANNGPYTRVHVTELKATAYVRSGVRSDRKKVELTIADDRECTLDEQGGTSGPFPSCSAADDLPDGSNAGCIGLAGEPSPVNRCGRFIELPTSGEPEECQSLGKGDQFDARGFCLTGDLEIVLEERTAAFRAEGAGNVLIGWDDTEAELGPNDEIVIPTADDFAAPTGPNGFRAIHARVDVPGGSFTSTLECVMGAAPTGGAQLPLRLTPNSFLISFPIQTP